MNPPRTPRLRLEFAFAYLIPAPALVGGLIWSAIFLGISWLVTTLDHLTLLEEINGVSRPSTIAVLMFACSWMIGLLPHIVRLSAAHEEWDLADGLPPAKPHERRLAEKKLLAQNLPSGRALLPATILALVVGVVVNTKVIEIDFENIRHPSILWLGLQILVLFQLMIRGMGFTHYAKIRRKPLLELAEHVDLLDLRPQHRAARCALRSSMTWIAGATLSSMFFFLSSIWLTQIIIAVVAIVAGFALFPTIFRMQSRISRAKKIELARLQKDVHRCRDAVLNHHRTPEGEPVPPGRLADLLGYMDHVENLPELPFHKGKLAIASLYFAVPLGSWLLVSGVQRLFGFTFS
jgi:hypothetical protein